MTTTQKIYKDFNNHLNEYIQTNGIQTPLEVKQLAKIFAIQSRNGEYDLTARKRYCTLFLTYCWKNNIEFPFEGLPVSWGHDILDVCFYDPDGGFTGDIDLQKLIKASKKRNVKKIRELCETRHNRRDIV
jgi:hypothetical protein